MGCADAYLNEYNGVVPNHNGLAPEYIEPWKDCKRFFFDPKTFLFGNISPCINYNGLFFDRNMFVVEKNYL